MMMVMQVSSQKILVETTECVLNPPTRTGQSSAICGIKAAPTQYLRSVVDPITKQARI
jgi:hypothetical protein